MRTLTLGLLLFLSACDGFDDVRKQDTIEAYEAYLDANPDGRNKVEAITRLEALYIERARESKSLEDYDAYLERFPKGAFAKAAYEERETHLWDWADRENTIEAWDYYIKEYPSFEAKKVREAKRRRAATEYRPNLEWTELVFEKANLAEDPEGPKNGWKFESQITNKGDKTLSSLIFTIRYLDEAGEVLATESWPVAASNFGVPVEEFRKEPLKPGETRQWDLLTGDVPEKWAEKAVLVPTSVRFQKLEAGRSE